MQSTIQKEFKRVQEIRYARIKNAFDNAAHNTKEVANYVDNGFYRARLTPWWQWPIPFDLFNLGSMNFSENEIKKHPSFLEFENILKVNKILIQNISVDGDGFGVYASLKLVSKENYEPPMDWDKFFENSPD